MIAAQTTPITTTALNSPRAALISSVPVYSSSCISRLRFCTSFAQSVDRIETIGTTMMIPTE